MFSGAGSPLSCHIFQVSYHDRMQSCMQLPAYVLVSGFSCHVIIIHWCISSHLAALHPHTLAHHSQFVTSTLLSFIPSHQAYSREVWGGYSCSLFLVPYTCSWHLNIIWLLLYLSATSEWARSRGNTKGSQNKSACVIGNKSACVIGNKSACVIGNKSTLLFCLSNSFMQNKCIVLICIYFA